MSKSVFPYPGGKSNYADWIISHIPDHECFVEAFGGAGGVLLNKEASQIDVYNDINSDLTHFFRVLREKPEELKKYLRRLPYSRDEYENIATAWFDDRFRPDDDVKRAAWFYFLRQSNFSGKFTKAGFSVSARPDDNRARVYSNGVEQLDEFAQRLNGIIVENSDYKQLVERYDKETTAFYFDPPYLEVGDDYYDHQGQFNHAEFVQTLEDIDGHWVTSYNTLPEGLSDYPVATRETRYTMSSNGHSQNTERLVMNFEPTDVQMFSATHQLDMEEYL